LLRNESERDKLTNPQLQAYNNLEYFQECSKNLLINIKEWLHENKVKDINLPDLD
jgi:hypothetical protein